MIEQVIEIPFSREWLNHSEWLDQQVGPRAPFQDCVDLDRPWHSFIKSGKIEVSFARATDATMFALRWL